MAYTDQLVVHLAALGFQLERVGERLPFATPTNAEMAAEGFQPVGRWLFKCCDYAFEVVLLFLVNPYVHHVTGYCEGHENHLRIRGMGNRFSLCRNRFYRYVFQKDICLLPGHFPIFYIMDANIINFCYICV